MIHKLAYDVQKYAWGKPASTSLAQQFARQNDDPKHSATPASTPVAELWLGTHPNAPCKLHGTDTLLSEVVRKDLDLPGLPFLLKTLSIGKALSIQVHPDRTYASKLHALHPQTYRDPNHKPEVAIALTAFEGLGGFRVDDEIVRNVKEYPELREMFKDEHVNRLLENQGREGFKDALRYCFKDLMTAEPAHFSPHLEALITRIKSAGASKALSPQVQLQNRVIIQLASQHPGDIGIFAPLLLNIVQLQPGEAIYMGADMPHCYLSGDIIECMANSDNVVRCGLTPKMKDVKTLMSMVDTRGMRAEEMRLLPQPVGEGKKLYMPPVPDFKVLRMAGKTRRADAIEGPSILFFTKGNGSISDGGSGEQLFNEGNAFYLRSGTEVAIKAQKDCECYQAFTLAKDIDAEFCV